MTATVEEQTAMVASVHELGAIDLTRAIIILKAATGLRAGVCRRLLEQEIAARPDRWVSLDEHVRMAGDLVWAGTVDIVPAVAMVRRAVGVPLPRALILGMLLKDQARRDRARRAAADGEGRCRP